LDDSYAANVLIPRTANVVLHELPILDPPKHKSGFLPDLTATNGSLADITRHRVTYCLILVPVDYSTVNSCLLSNDFRSGKWGGFGRLTGAKKKGEKRKKGEREKRRKKIPCSFWREFFFNLARF
jgi:hypothetical protein